MTIETQETVEAAETEETTETANDTTETPKTATEATTDGTDEAGAEGNEEPADKTFPKLYVDQLRDEAATYRKRAKDRDDIAQRLHEVLVAQTGKLADATDLPFDEANLSDPDAMTTAIEELLARKPHLGSRKPSGDIGQGILSEGDGNVNLAGILRSNAR